MKDGQKGFDQKAYMPTVSVIPNMCHVSLFGNSHIASCMSESLSTVNRAFNAYKRDVLYLYSYKSNNDRRRHNQPCVRRKQFNKSKLMN